MPFVVNNTAILKDEDTYLFSKLRKPL